MCVQVLIRNREIFGMNNNNIIYNHLELLNICACNQLKLHITIHNFIMLTHMSADHYAQNFLLKVAFFSCLSYNLKKKFILHL